MAKQEPTRPYNVWAHCRQTVSVEIRAQSLEEALEKAKELDEEDFVTVNGEYADGEFEITGVLKND